VKDLVFNFLELVLVLCSFNDELLFLGLELWLLLFDDQSEELVTETLEGNHEVDQGDLG